MGKKLTEKEAKRKILDKLGTGYSITGDYINMKTRSLFIKHSCGFIYSPLPKDVVSGKSTCPKCSKYYHEKKTLKDLDKSIKNEYEFLDTPNNFKETIRVKHKLCNYTFNTTLSYLSGGRSCAKCQGIAKFQIDDILKLMVKKRHDYKEYTLYSEYKNIDTDIKIKHCCGKIFTTTMYRFLYRDRKCDCITGSWTEKIFSDILNKYKFDYSREKKFETLKNKRFDFYLEEYNLLIEYDGEHHFLNANSNKSNRSFKNIERIKEYDLLKNKFALKNEINLIRFNKKNYSLFETIIQSILSNATVDIDLILKEKIFLILNNEIFNEKEYYLNMDKDYFGYN